MEQLEFNLQFRWFVGLGIDDRVWDATVFTKNRQALNLIVNGPTGAGKTLTSPARSPTRPVGRSGPSSTAASPN